MTKSTFKAIASLLVFAAVLVLLLTRLEAIWLILKNILAVFTPFLIGFAIAYVVNIPYTFMYEKAFVSFDKPDLKTGRPSSKFLSKLRKPLSIVIAFALLFAIIGLVLGILIPQVSTSLQKVFDNFASYYTSFQEWVFSIAAKFGFKYELMTDVFADINAFIAEYTGGDAENIFDINTILQKIASFLFPQLMDITKNVYTVVYNTIISIVISIYYIANKEVLLNQCRKVAYALIPKKHLGKVLRVVDLCNHKVGRFLYGKIIDSLIIGLICFIGLIIIGVDYALLLSVIVAVTNIIPFFGPFIGAIPGAVLLLMVDPLDALWFVIFIIILQQVDGNIIGPKVLGNTVGISGFWIMFSVLTGGGLFGFVGMLLGVPVFAVIYLLVGEKINDRVVRLGYASKDKVHTEIMPRVAYEDGHIIENPIGGGSSAEKRDFFMPDDK